ncbi:hypothetical protein JNW90_19555 [Micromonospora sp. STR1s_5]|nr:hypothetical protein [Micromonospora sp. STR1s_5]
MLRRAGVDIRLDAVADRISLAQEDFEAVVVATGSAPRRDGYTSLRPGADGMRIGRDISTVWDVFITPETFDGPAIVIEDDPHLSGTAAAEKLAERGYPVTIITPHMHAGADLPVHHAPALYRRLTTLGITVVPTTFVTAIEPGRLICEERFSGASKKIVHSGPIVLAMGNLANDALARALDGSGLEVLVVGDALAPRQIDMAILDGERAGWTI